MSETIRLEVKQRESCIALGTLTSCVSDGDVDVNENGAISLKGSALPSRYVFLLHDKLKNFFSSELLNEDGLPLAGALHGADRFWGRDSVSIFDVVLDGVNWGIFISPEQTNQKWELQRKEEKTTLILSGGNWNVSVYQGNEPNWAKHAFPFHSLPDGDSDVQHAFIRGLLDFFAGTRRSSLGTYFQKPNTNGVYDGDGIPDTYFQFLSTYRYLSPTRRSYWQSQINWLGDHMRFDGCIPWGGCNPDAPYYHLWKRQDCGLFFDGNGLWLEMVYRLWEWDHVKPNLELVVRACDFYLHYMTEEGLVAAESKKRGCEWADLLQNGWHSSLINVLAYRGLIVAQKMLSAFGEMELADRYGRHASRLRKALNLTIQEGGLWNQDGYVDWRDQDGTIHPHWRTDTHMLSIIFGVPDPEKIELIWQAFDEAYFNNEPSVPAPYLPRGSWLEPVDDMLDSCRNFGCGQWSMLGRMGGSLAAALRSREDKSKAEKVFRRLVEIVNREDAVYEMYDRDGNGSGAISYIEHALSPLLAITFQDFLV